MNWVVTIEGFEFHTKCKSLTLNHLCFVDDMSVFCKGELIPLVLILKGLGAFSTSSKMIINASKSIYFQQIWMHKCYRIYVRLLSTQQVNYLLNIPGGANITQETLILDCEMLVDKLTCRIYTQGRRNLSYTGKIQLINSVLMHLQTYQSTMFQLPKGVLKNIISRCRNFLWSVHVHINRVPLMASKVVCRGKREGGHGITNYIVWNEAASLKYVWNKANKADNLWVKWVDHV